MSRADRAYTRRMRWSLAIFLAAACGGATPKPGGSAGRAPADATLRPDGDGWFCTQQTAGRGGGCFRDEAACTAVRDDSYAPCAPQPTAYCHTHVFVPDEARDFFCLPTEAMCEARVADWSQPPTDYRALSACAAWD